MQLICVSDSNSVILIIFIPLRNVSNPKYFFYHRIKNLYFSSQQCYSYYLILFQIFLCFLFSFSILLIQHYITSSQYLANLYMLLSIFTKLKISSLYIFKRIFTNKPSIRDPIVFVSSFPPSIHF